VLLACSPLLICLNAADPPGGCATTSGIVTPKTAVALPAAPSFLAPIAPPAVKAGDDARLAWRKSDAALSAANGRLAQSRAWYLGVRARYGAAKLK